MAGKNITELQDAVYRLLSRREQEEFISHLNRYQKRRDVQELVHKLGFILNPSARSKILLLLRRVLPSRDVRLYDQLVRSVSEPNLHSRNTYPKRHEYQMNSRYSDVEMQRPGSTISVPASLRPPASPELPNRRHHKGMVRPSLSQDMMRNGSHKVPSWEAGHMPKLKKILMQKPDDLRESLGFSIRGGAEHGIGIYVSYVDVDSVAEKQGLVPGDQVLSVNGIPFKKIFHDEAAKVRPSSFH